ncbi:hypothetical protein SAMN04488541_1001121 [Thermoflexibacter ruber]|uniref:Uncharacterized protein n=1 Tax=Thermoflexibacter ruber TaxID=1003 RepID=A0A1I2ACQ1_9BACT|nr:hypothetical protein SAMN04488541_1001121 [Thermoflexibacter ruber]
MPKSIFCQNIYSINPNSPVILIHLFITLSLNIMYACDYQITFLSLILNPFKN